MSGIEVLVRHFFSKRPENNESQKDYLTIDSSGHATFDVASYLVSAEGHKKLEEIAEANKAELIRARQDAEKEPARG